MKKVKNIIVSVFAIMFAAILVKHLDLMFQAEKKTTTESVTIIWFILLALFMSLVGKIMIQHLIYRIKVKMVATPTHYKRLFRPGQSWQVLNVTNVSGTYYGVVTGPFDEKNIKSVVFDTQMSPGVYGCNKNQESSIELVRLWDVGFDPTTQLQPI